MILQPNLDREIEERAEAGLAHGIAIDLAPDVANDAAEPGAQELQFPPHPLELMRVGITPDHDGGALGDAAIALAQRDPFTLGQRHQPLQCPMHQSRVGRMGDRLWLHRGIDRHPLQVPGRDRAGLARYGETLLHDRHELLFAQPLPPSRQRRAIERQLVTEALLAAKILIIRVLDPACAQHFIR